MKNRSPLHWLTIAICCGLASSSIGICSNTLGVFFTPVSDALGVGRGPYALHATLASLTTGFFSPVTMVLMYRYKVRPLVGFGILLAGGSLIAMSVCSNLFLIYLLAILRGVGVSFFSLAVITWLIGNWFEARHGFAVGLTLAFSGLSGAIFSPLFGSLIGTVGWRQTYVIMGLITIGLALPGVLLLGKRPQDRHLLPYGAKHPHFGDEAETAPAAASGSIEGSASSEAAPVADSASTTAIPHGGAASAASGTKPGARRRGAPREGLPVRGLPLVLMAVYTVFGLLVTGIGQHFPGYAVSMGGSLTLGATLLSSAMIGNIVFKLLIGLLSDRIGPVDACKIMGATNIAALALLHLTNPVSQLFVSLAAAFLYGAIYAIGAVGIALLTRHLFGVANYARAYPLMSIFTSIGSAMSLSVIGFLYDTFRTYHIALLAGIVVGAANLIILQFGFPKERKAS